jgi:hypothetical protein
MDTALALRIDNAFTVGSTDIEPDNWAFPGPFIYFEKFLSSLSKKETDSVTDTTKLNLEGTIDWIDFALKNLDEVYDECSVANWDGYNAQPISREAYFEASKLLRILPNSFPMPDILPEPDGGIGLEWYKDKGFSFVVSVSSKNIITYVGRFGKNNYFYGTESYKDSVTEIILNGLRRLFSN